MYTRKGKRSVFSKANQGDADRRPSLIGCSQSSTSKCILVAPVPGMATSYWFLSE